MITLLRSVTVCVRSQDRAVEFYVGKLGFEKRRDEPLGEGARWIEVAPAGADTALVLFTPPGLEKRIGEFTGIMFDCDDILTTYEELKSRGVEFKQAPAEQWWGMLMAQFEDADGNSFVLVQSKR